MDTLKLSIVAPNGQIFSDDVKSVTLPGKEGEFGVLPGHASLVSSLTVGVIIIEKADSTDAVAINWGHVKVSESAVDVLVDGAVALTSGQDSEIARNIEAAKDLVNSVKDANVSLAAVEAKINSFA
ncbi:ATP synthase F1 subunit epsilon [Halarcobacter bivalviorum]|uniref:ATP synthase epsilon chain n=1 Tax=Halarcobacter bivalviorum TaxID=663364 RepID=A0AAX2A6N7_9BACT|nr:ATP synthase F1 subunit epsilon [Halarcobacter bivalviorum]AXH12943.1 ATP synthase, F1 complex, epsilon subunit [Halarcobacter bivalviorum]RXK03512.1 F0F1 ATP synthase subunit epsilon [Halarcobacter bivalviorum]RXK09247.1 F0F1 ATP synthase subunit epsilon [Halarcobacter bivalviorum]